MPIRRTASFREQDDDLENTRAERRRVQQERRDEATRITPTTTPIPGRVTYPNGTFVTMPNPGTAAAGVLGGQFGASPAMPSGGPPIIGYNPRPYSGPPIIGYNSNGPPIVSRSGQIQSPTAIPTSSGTSLIGDGNNNGGYGTPGHYGYNPSGNRGGWMLKYNNKGELVWKLNRNPEQQARVGTRANYQTNAYQTPEEMEQSLYYQNMSWRLATG